MLRNAILVFALLTIAITSMVSASSEYAGSDTCKTCHKDVWEDFMKTGHPYKLRPADEAKKGNEKFGIRKVTELPERYTWDDISYVIGGVWWKTRFINETGYIITGDAVQYNIETSNWVPYHSGEVKPYTCGNCHTTGYKKEGHQDDFPGITGTWAFPGIECEACHGPALRHVADPSNVSATITTSSELCGRCHVRGDPSKIPASGGFIKHHEQYPELLASPHKKLNCVVCHDPHKSVKNPMVKNAIRYKCEECHEDVAKEYASSKLAKEGVECIDCHMPFATKSAVKKSNFQGDIRTHLFKINVDPKASMFTEDGKYAMGYVTLDFACLYCHTDKSKEWAATYAANAHGFEEFKETPFPTPPTTVPTEIKKTPGFEAILVVSILLILYATVKRVK